MYHHSGGSRISRRGGVDLRCRHFSPKMCAKMKELGPIGGVDPLGGVDLQCGHFSPKMCVKIKELGPVGGHAPGMPPRSTNASAEPSSPVSMTFGGEKWPLQDDDMNEENFLPPKTSSPI